MGLLLGNQYDCQVTEKGLTSPSKTLGKPWVFYLPEREPYQATRANPVKTGDAKLRVFFHHPVEMIAEPPKWDVTPAMQPLPAT